MEDLILKYRPKEMSEVWGNTLLKKLWKNALPDKLPKSIILYGNFGTGKTTIGKIMLKDITTAYSGGKFLCDCPVEIDGARCTFESLQQSIHYRASYAVHPHAYFIDEAHRVHPKVQEVFLKAIEEMEDIHFIFATTDMEEIDKGIISRSLVMNITNPKKEEIREKLNEIAEKEMIKILPEVIDYIIEISEYNPRNCMKCMNTIKMCKNDISFKEAQDIFSTFKV
ncbi:MAG: AAA family ATPase [Planctomycetota bacterium]